LFLRTQKSTFTVHYLSDLEKYPPQTNTTMRDLRKKVLLESGKTTSRAARAKVGSTFSTPDGSPAGSPAHSRSASRVTSRAGSRNATDEEADSDDFDSDDFLARFADLQENELDMETEDWVSSIQRTVAGLSDVKNNDAGSRQTLLTQYIWLMRHNIASEGVGD